jgi:ankyrin repeat protein
MDQAIIDIIKEGDNNQLEQKLKENPLLIDEKTDQGVSLLQYAAYLRNSDAIEIIRKYKPELNIFEAACVGDNNIIVQSLLKDPDLLNAFSSDGFTLLGLASYFGHIALIKSLLEMGANPNISSNNQLKVSPIHSACAISNFHIAELLINNGADVNAKQMQGVTPLHSAAHNGQTLLAKLLIHNGADLNAKMENGFTPLSLALEKNFQETAEFIKNLGGE